MLLFNMHGGAGAGKSTAAAYLYTELKKAGFRIELVREKARDFIYAQSIRILDRNQFLVSAVQFEEVLKVKEAGFDIAVSDSPLCLGHIYGRLNGLDYTDELRTLVRKVENQFETLDVMLRRVQPFDREARIHDEQVSVKVDTMVRQEVGDFWLEIDGDEAGLEVLRDRVIAEAAKRLR